MIRILIADDEYLLGVWLSELLEEAGFDTRIVGDGQSALAMALEFLPDLLITDFMMPGLTGLELAERLRGEPASHDLPIILVSGTQGALARQRPDLFQAVLDKPYDPDRLLATIAQVLGDQRG